MKKKLLSIVQLAVFYLAIFYFGAPELWSLPHFYILFLVGCLALIFQPGFHAFESGASTDRGTAAQILWSVQLTQVAAVMEAVFFRFPDSFVWDSITSIGLISMLLGLCLRTFAVLHLGKAFTWHIDPEKATSLITDGPYRLCRHPSYVGAFLLYTGAVVFLHAQYALIASLVVLPMAFLRRMKWEEVELSKHFGEEYDEYCRRVGRISPFL